MKRVFSIVLSLLLILCTLLPIIVFAEDVPQTTLTEVTFSQTLNMIKGKYEYIQLNNVDSNTKLTLKSSNSSVATINKEGKITAKKCGVAIISINAIKNEVSYTAKIKVNVEIAKNRKTKIYGKKPNVAEDNEKLPYLKLPIQLVVNKTTSVVASCSKNIPVNYSSSNNAVAKVDKKGTITAVKEGKAIIKATLNSNGRYYTYATVVDVVKSDKKKTITKSERNKFYSTSAFVGSSIGVGQRMYFDQQEKGYLGKPLMLVRGCYSFMNDKNKVSKYMIQYKGKSIQARYAIKKSGVDKVFISMGTNDLFKKTELTYKDYVEYLEGIRKTNPKVVIFIESTTSVHSKNQKKYLNSKSVKKLNSMIEEYCKTQKDMYFVDVSSRMNDKNGNLKSSCCSDSYVHLTFEAYKLWMEDLTAYTDKLMIQEQNATDAVKTAFESKDASHIAKAKKIVAELEKSSVKISLSNQLRNIKK